MIKLICATLTSLSILTGISGVRQECKNTPDNTIRYSFKLQKPGICFTEDCREQDFTNDVYTLYSALFQTQTEKEDRERTEIRDRFIIFGERKAPLPDGVDNLFPEIRPDEFFPEGSAPETPTDLDICCPTRHTHKLYRELTNAENILRTIIHFENLDPPVYQFVPEGTCASDYGSDTCSGQCFQELRDHYLLVHDPSATIYPPVKFDKFRIKSYCSCKGL